MLELSSHHSHMLGTCRERYSLVYLAVLPSITTTLLLTDHRPPLLLIDHRPQPTITTDRPQITFTTDRL